MIFKIVVGLAILTVAFALYVRFSPTDAAAWADPDLEIKAEGDYAGSKTYEAVRRVSGDDVIARLRSVALAAARTTQLDTGGSAWVTFETRSALMGYPDYTSARVVEVAGQPLLQIYARSRFGKEDLGVNKARVLDWLGQLDLLTP